MCAYKTPFTAKNGIIRDSSGKEVRLWGVNYYAPFNHNYINIKELGIDHRKAIDEDVEHMELLGLNFIRMHLYDREITDKDGNIVENDHLIIFDYLIEKLAAKNFYVMITPINWWNTVENQVMMDNYYAFWHIGTNRAFGFSNFYGKDALIWHPEAIECQKRYLRQLFNRKNTISGRKLAEYENLVVIEVFNEPLYITEDLLFNQTEKNLKMEEGIFSSADQRGTLYRQWESFCQLTHFPNRHVAFKKFRAFLLEKYLQQMFAIVEDEFGDSVLKAHIDWHINDPDIRKTLLSSPIDALTVGWYLNGPSGFDASNTDYLDYFTMTKEWVANKLKQDCDRLAKISYEFNATGTLKGYPYGAIAYAFGICGIQMAAMFTYTPAAVAAYNPGWLVHYMSFLHTPSKACALAAAGDIFRQTQRGGSLPGNDEIWEKKNWLIDRERDTVLYKSKENLIHSHSIDAEIRREESPKNIVGIGSSPFVTYEGNGIYSLKIIDEDTIVLLINSDQRYVNDPNRGRCFRYMANRYIDVNKTYAVSRLVDRENKLTINYPDFNTFEVIKIVEGKELSIDVEKNTFIVTAGRYIIKRVNHQNTRKKGLKREN